MKYAGQMPLNFRLSNTCGKPYTYISLRWKIVNYSKLVLKCIKQRHTTQPEQINGMISFELSTKH